MSRPMVIERHRVPRLVLPLPYLSVKSPELVLRRMLNVSARLCHRRVAAAGLSDMKRYRREVEPHVTVPQSDGTIHLAQKAAET
jgi:hypothetical protein